MRAAWSFPTASELRSAVLERDLQTAFKIDVVAFFTGSTHKRELYKATAFQGRKRSSSIRLHGENTLGLLAETPLIQNTDPSELVAIVPGGGGGEGKVTLKISNSLENKHSIFLKKSKN